MKKVSIHIFSSIDKLAGFLSVSISENIKETKGNRPISIALSGGSTPREIFKSLALNHTNEIDWSKVMIFWGDERCVSPASDESNYKMAYDNLIKKTDIPAKNIFRIEAEKDAVKEAERYAGLVDALLPHHADLPQFDLFLLGLGEDGHTASIFPGVIHLFNSDKLFEVSLHPASSQKRITATGKLINNSRQVCFLVTGQSKAEIVARIIEKGPGWQDLPASRVIPTNGSIAWMLDEAAGRLLSERSGSFRDSDRFLSS